MGPWRTLALLSIAELAGMALWFVGAAISPQLRVQWHLDTVQIGWLTAVVQLGFVAGTAAAAVLNLADVLPARAYFAISALLAAVANASLAWAPGFHAALAGRFAVGFFLAGVYPPGMKMIATWFRSYRGLAIGTIVGAITVGKSTPYLLHALPGLDVRALLLIASINCAIGGLLVAVFYHDGPHAFPRREFSWQLAGLVLRHRETMLATGGYLGHMWELYAMWTWLPAFLVASEAARAQGAALSRSALDLWSAAAIAIGGLGSVWAGWAAERIGYASVVTRAMAVSGACALAIGFAFGGSPWLLLPVALVWGCSVVADSAQFSALVTEVAPPHAVGTALTLQTSMGFLLTMVTIQLVPVLVQAVGWRWAFPILALGPLCGIASIRLLRHQPELTAR